MDFIALEHHLEETKIHLNLLQEELLDFYDKVPFAFPKPPKEMSATDKLRMANTLIKLKKVMLEQR